MYEIGLRARLGLLTLTVTGLLVLVLGGCSENSSGSMNAAPLTQQGTNGAGSAPGTVTLEWIAPTENTNGTPLTDLAGYHIRYGTNPEDLTRSIDLPSAKTTMYEITGLSPGTYYFAVSAYTAIGTESADSGVGYKTI